MEKPDWWPENPYPVDVFPTTQEQYEKLVPDSQVRTAISGMLGRRFWEIASQIILDRLLWADKVGLVRLYKRQ